VLQLGAQLLRLGRRCLLLLLRLLLPELGRRQRRRQLARLPLLRRRRSPRVGQLQVWQNKAQARAG
jgi:hypothetical protein